MATYHQRYYQKNKEAMRAQQNAYHKRTRRDRYLRILYDLTPEQYTEMVVEQKGLCAICFKPETQITKSNGQTRPLSVDHCHTSGRVRGLLCNVCNQALGLFKDDPTILSSAINYLNKG
jgi:hypothetical protein